MDVHPMDLYVFDRVADELDGPVIVEVGANRGDWTLAALKALHPRRVVTYEPQAGAFAALGRRVHGMGVDHVNAAVGASAGSVTLHASPVGDCLRASVHALPGMTREERVRVVTLNDSLPDLDVAYIDLLKIDAEGSELAVLRGSGDYRPRFIQFEYNDAGRDGGVKWPELWALLDDAGYAIGEARPGFPRVTAEEPWQVDCDYLAWTTR